MSLNDILPIVLVAYILSTGMVYISWMAGGGKLWGISNLPVLIVLGPIILALTITAVPLLLIILLLGRFMAALALDAYDELGYRFKKLRRRRGTR